MMQANYDDAAVMIAAALVAGTLVFRFSVVTGLLRADGDDWG